MRRLALLALLVPLVAGCGSSSSAGLVNEGGDPAHYVPLWIQQEHLPHRAFAGAGLFAAAGCNACHVYLDVGQQDLNAPDLTAIGQRHLGVAFEIRHLECPSCAVPGSPMPPFASLGPKRLRELAIFLEASKGTR